MSHLLCMILRSYSNLPIHQTVISSRPGRPAAAPSVPSIRRGSAAGPAAQLRLPASRPSDGDQQQARPPSCGSQRPVHQTGISSRPGRPAAAPSVPFIRRGSAAGPAAQLRLPASRPSDGDQQQARPPSCGSQRPVHQTGISSRPGRPAAAPSVPSIRRGSAAGPAAQLRLPASRPSDGDQQQARPPSCGSQRPHPSDGDQQQARPPSCGSQRPVHQTGISSRPGRPAAAPSVPSIRRGSAAGPAAQLRLPASRPSDGDQQQARPPSCGSQRPVHQTGISSRPGRPAAAPSVPSIRRGSAAGPAAQLLPASRSSHPEAQEVRRGQGPSRAPVPSLVPPSDPHP